MYNKLNQLSFVIGLFFSISSVILFVNAFVSRQPGRLSMYTAAIFLIFGLLMMFVKSKPSD